MFRPLLVVQLTVTVMAADYYVSPGGNDAATGLSTATPWQTIGKVNARFGTLLPGDRILFERGGSFPGCIRISRSGTAASPIVLGAYTGTRGTARPLITGFVDLSTWRNDGGGVYSAVLAGPAQTNMVVLDGIQQAMGRYPDTGFRTYDAINANLSITDSTLGHAVDWTGAEAVIRKNEWSLDRCTITAHAGNTLSYTSLGSAWVGTAGYGYFIQNDRRCVTSPGEWYHDAAGGRLAMHFGAAGPAGRSVRAAVEDSLLRDDGGYDYITVDGLAFSGAIGNAVEFAGVNDGCALRDCEVSFVGKVGITLAGGTGGSVERCTVRWCNREGIRTLATASTIAGNTIADIGTKPGQSLGADGYVGIYTPGRDVDINHNIIRNVGYNGISLRYSGAASITNNYIDTVCTVLDDGAGIYTSSPDASVRRIEHNVIVNVIGTSDGSSDARAMSEGIYLDETSTNVLVSGNTLAHCGGSGIKLHKAHDCTLADNSIYDTKWGILLLNSSGSNIRNVRMERNVVVARTLDQFVMRFDTKTNDVALFGTSDGNVFARPLSDLKSFWFYWPALVNYKYRELDAWQGYTGQDAHSTVSPKTITTDGELAFSFNASDAPVTWSFPGLRRLDALGAIYEESAVIPAWSSLVLIEDGTASGHVNQAPTISAIAAQTANGAPVTVSFTVGDAETPATALRVGAASSDVQLMPVANMVFGGSGANRTVRLTPAPGRAGSATITVTVSDGGATTSSSFVLTVVADTTPPATPPAPVASSTTSRTPTLSGTAEAGVLIKIYDDGTLIGQTTATTGGTWIWTASPPLADGAHPLSVVAVDAAGNRSGMSPALIVDVPVGSGATASSVDAGSTGGCGAGGLAALLLAGMGLRRGRRGRHG